MNINFKSVYSQRYEHFPMIVSAKKGIHPDFYADAKVFCGGEVVMVVGGTQKEYVVDIWSGNHPYYQHGGNSSIVVDDGQLNRFKKRFASLGKLSAVQTITKDEEETKS